jgi:DNA-binding NarL/FixJ family response regulator
MNSLITQLESKGLIFNELEITVLVTKGLSNAEIANQLFLSEKTIKFKLTNIYNKLNVKSRAQLIVYCLPHLGTMEV